MKYYLHTSLLTIITYTLFLNSSLSEGTSAYGRNDSIFTYTNPLSGITRIGDPYVIKHEGKYYMYATSSAEGFKVWQSDNLVDWEEKGLAFQKSSPENNWGTGNFWAPEVKFFNGKFYMSYSALAASKRMKMRIAISDNPLGPFINWSKPFLEKDSFSYIDPDIFIEDDRIYMFFAKDCSVNMIDGKHTSQIFVCELDKELKDFIGTPKLILTPDQDWEHKDADWRWNEGPFVMKHENRYYLMYSANAYNSIDYSVGYAVSESPIGPWVKYAGNPILKKDPSIRVSGPGHNCVTTSPDNKEFFIVYHTHSNFDSPSGNRNLCIDRMTLKNGEITISGPTRSPQPLPSGAKSMLQKQID